MALLEREQEMLVGNLTDQLIELSEQKSTSRKCWWGTLPTS